MSNEEFCPPDASWKGLLSGGDTSRISMFYDKDFLEIVFCPDLYPGIHDRTYRVEQAQATLTTHLQFMQRALRGYGVLAMYNTFRTTSYGAPKNERASIITYIVRIRLNHQDANQPVQLLQSATFCTHGLYQDSSNPARPSKRYLKIAALRTRIQGIWSAVQWVRTYDYGDTTDE